jgi:Protein of unknown function (DUF2786)
VARIQKLQALAARGGTPAERAVAAAKLKTLQAKLAALSAATVTPRTTPPFPNATVQVNGKVGSDPTEVARLFARVPNPRPHRRFRDTRMIGLGHPLGRKTLP